MLAAEKLYVFGSFLPNTWTHDGFNNHFTLLKKKKNKQKFQIPLFIYYFFLWSVLSVAIAPPIKNMDNQMLPPGYH